MKKVGAAVLSLIGLAVLSSLPARADDPLMGKSPWNFTPVNRAGLAIAIKQVEDPGSGAGGSGGTTIVCGGTSGGSGDGSTGSGSSATANSSCIIINNSDGAIVNTDQTSNGNQSSNSNANSTSSSTTSTGSIDEVSAILNGNRQGN